MAGLSTAANAFSVVGLADVVYRLGVSTASLYSRYRNTSRDTASLVDEIQAFVESVAQIRVYLDEYHESPYAQSDGQSLPPQLSKILSDCEKVLQHLQQIADKNKSDPDDGLAIQMMKRWRWTLQNEHVSKYCKRIRHLNMNLQLILELNGRKNGVILRKELKATREDINTAESTVHQALHTMEGNLNSSQERTNAVVRTQTTLISQMIKESEDRHLGLGNIINFNQENSNALIHSQTTLINQMIKISEDHHQELLERIPNLTLEQTENDDFIFQGHDLGSIVFPLLLMKSDLFKTIKTLQNEGVLKVSRSEAEWILQQFDNLLARGHEAAAKDLKGRLQNDDTKPLPRSFHKLRKSSSKQVQEHISEDTKISAFNQIGRIEHISTVSIPSGVLILQTGSSNTPAKGHQDSADLQVIRLSFFPKPEFSSVNLCMLMTNEFGRNIDLQIPRLIQTYNTIRMGSENSKIIQRLIKADDARGLENVFKDGGGSPNDVFENGWSLSATAAHFQSIAVSVRHGCDPNQVSIPDQQNLIHTFILGCYRYTPVKEADSHGINGVQRLVNCVQLPTNKFRDVFSCMVGMGCELEGGDVDGYTALLRACLLCQPDMIAALIDMGANRNATTDNGYNALHCSLIVDQRLGHDDGSSYLSLVLLLSQKVDPNHLDSQGRSPSDLACRNLTSLDRWVEAIEHAGYETLWIMKRVDCGHEEAILIVVSAGFELSGNSTLPISNMTLDEWIEKRSGCRQPFGCLECQVNEIETESEESETESDESEIETDESEIEFDEAETETDEAESKTDESEIEFDEAESETDESEIEFDEAETETDEAESESDESEIEANEN